VHDVGTGARCAASWGALRLSIQKAICCIVLCLWASAPALAEKATEKYATLHNIHYYDALSGERADEYLKERCKLDVYHPQYARGYATLVWFHGGGLTAGERYFPALRDRGIALVAVNYRLAPRAQTPAFLEDAAAAVAWVMRNIEQYGGDPSRVFVGGHSAGAYLAAMIAMDPKWLAAHGVSTRQLAGVMPVSGQMTTHFLVKKQRGDAGPQLRPIIDEYAPLYHAAADLPPICLVVGGRDIEFKSRVEENELMAVTLRNLGARHVEFHEMAGLDHNGVEQGAMLIIPGFLKRVLKTGSAGQ
jgi:acetyl esterase/lipase